MGGWGWVMPGRPKAAWRLMSASASFFWYAGTFYRVRSSIRPLLCSESRIDHCFDAGLQVIRKHRPSLDDSLQIGCDWPRGLPTLSGFEGFLQGLSHMLELP